jgi:hypothetical protein
MSNLVLTYTHALPSGETLELYHNSNAHQAHRLVWLDKRAGRKAAIRDYRDFTSYVSALAAFQRIAKLT